MGLSRLLKNEWVIYVKSFVLHGHNDAHATNSLFTSNLYIFPYKLVGKLSSQSYNDYDDYEGESSFNTLNKILVAYFAIQQHPNKHVFFYVENAAYGWNWGGGGCHASVSLSKPCGTVLGSHLNESLNG